MFLETIVAAVGVHVRCDVRVDRRNLDEEENLLRVVLRVHHAPVLRHFIRIEKLRDLLRGFNLLDLSRVVVRVVLVVELLVSLVDDDVVGQRVQ